jgi:hypothetical protein
MAGIWTNVDERGFLTGVIDIGSKSGDKMQFADAF